MTANAERKSFISMTQAQVAQKHLGICKHEINTRMAAAPKQYISPEFMAAKRAASTATGKSRVASLETLTGVEFLETTLKDWSDEGIPPFYMCVRVTLTPIDEEVEMTDEEGNVTGTQHMNVAINGLFTQGTDEIWGVYDAEDGTITIPFQYAGTQDTYGPYYTVGLLEGNDLDENITLHVNEEEDGSMSITIDESLVGIGTLLVEGEYKNYLWSGEDSDTWQMHSPNATLHAYQCELNEEKTGWVPTDKTSLVYIENLGDVAYIHNFFDPLFDGDMNFVMQVIFDTETPGLFEAPMPVDLYYANSMVYSMYNYRDTDNPKAAIPGYVSDAGWYIFGVPAIDEETGDTKVTWDWIYPGVKDGDSWFGIAMTNMAIEPGITEGIGTVLAPNATAKTGTFDLAGKRINGNANGIVIRNGQKFIVK